MIFNITFAWEHAVAITDETDADKLVSHRFPQFSFADEMNPQFFKYIIADEKFRYHLWLSSPGGAGRNRVLNIPEMLQYQCYLPKKIEQEHLANWFTTLDKSITQHQSELEKLQSLKSAMLEKMFPQDGADMPEIRFKGFTEAWKQYKLGEIGKARSGFGFPDNEQGGISGIPFFKVSDMNLAGNECEMTVANNYVTEKQIKFHRWSPIKDLPAVFFAKVGAAVMLNRKRLCRFPFLMDNNTMAYSFDEKLLDSTFAKSLFETVDLTSLVQIGALPSYNTEDVEQIEVYLPSTSEQQCIGEYFEHLDNLILFYHQELEKLQSIKKALLEKMFV